MTTEQHILIRESFAILASKGRITSLVFYQNLFALDPALRPMFRHDIEQQGDKLMQALRFAVETLERPRELQGALEALGRRHVHYGVEDKHYDTVGTALIGTMQQLLGPVFTSEARKAWLEVYSYIATTMKEAAAKETRASTPDGHPHGVSAGLQKNIVNKPVQARGES